MIHNHFRRIALAQGLLPTHAEPKDMAAITHAGAVDTNPDRHPGHRRHNEGEAAIGFPLASIDPSSDRQIQA